MELTTTLGAVVEVKPLSLADGKGYILCKKVIQAAGEMEDCDNMSEAWWAKREDLRVATVELCGHIGVFPEQVGEGDLTNLITVLQTGRLTEDEENPS